MTQSQKVKHCEHGVNPRQGEGILQENEILEVKTGGQFNASFSRQPGEFFLLLGQELISSPFLMPVSRVRLLAILCTKLY